MSWTDEEMLMAEHLREHHGLSFSQVANRLGKTTNSTIGMVSSLLKEADRPDDPTSHQPPDRPARPVVVAKKERCMRMISDLIDLEARLIHETTKAWLLDLGQDEPIWFPKSACEFDGETLTMPEPLAIEKGAL